MRSVFPPSGSDSPETPQRFQRRLRQAASLRANLHRRKALQRLKKEENPPDKSEKATPLRRET